MIFSFYSVDVLNACHILSPVTIVRIFCSTFHEQTETPEYHRQWYKYVNAVKRTKIERLGWLAWSLTATLSFLFGPKGATISAK